MKYAGRYSLCIANGVVFALRPIPKIISDIIAFAAPVLFDCRTWNVPYRLIAKEKEDAIRRLPLPGTSGEYAFAKNVTADFSTSYGTRVVVRYCIVSGATGSIASDAGMNLNVIPELCRLTVRKVRRQATGPQRECRGRGCR